MPSSSDSAPSRTSELRAPPPPPPPLPEPEPEPKKPLPPPAPAGEGSSSKLRCADCRVMGNGGASERRLESEEAARLDPAAAEEEESP